MWSSSWIVASFLIMGCGADPTHDNPLSSGDEVSWNVPESVPDAMPDGVRLGPLVLPDDWPIAAVGLCIDMQHPCPADLRMWLCYDEDVDGVDDVRVPIELYLGRSGGWNEPEPYACPQEFDGALFYGGAESTLLLPLFGREGGGVFTLLVSDSVAQDQGMVRSWSICRLAGSGIAL